MLNKKATAAGRKVLFYMIFGIISMITVMVLINIIADGLSEISRIPPGLEEYVIINRFLHSPECFAYNDINTERAYPLIEWESFADGNLRYCYNADSQEARGFKLTLKIDDKEKSEKTVSTANWEGFLRKEIKKGVLVLKDGKQYNGELIIGIQYENK